MSNNLYILFVLLIGVVIGILLCCLIEWVTDNYRPKKKVKTVQPQIEAYGKDGKRLNVPARTFDKTI